MAWVVEELTQTAQDHSIAAPVPQPQGNIWCWSGLHNESSRAQQFMTEGHLT